MVGIQGLEKIYIRNIVYILELKRITSLLNEMTSSLFMLDNDDLGVHIDQGTKNTEFFKERNR